MATIYTLRAHSGDMRQCTNGQIFLRIVRLFVRVLLFRLFRQINYFILFEATPRHTAYASDTRIQREIERGN